MKTSELTGAALDWAVAKCEGRFNEDGDYWADPEGIWYFLTARKNTSEGLTWTNTSTNWAQGGPIIEREGIGLRKSGDKWFSELWADNSGMAKNHKQKFQHNRYALGPTPLIAAMRCYVASKMGDEVEIPEGLQ